MSLMLHKDQTMRAEVIEIIFHTGVYLVTAALMAQQIVLGGGWGKMLLCWGEIMSIFLEEKLLNAGLTFHITWHSHGCDAGVSLTV